jgi:hypothetical protein
MPQVKSRWLASFHNMCVLLLPSPACCRSPPQYIESLLRKYIGEYVACQMCRSFKTNLTRDNVSRLFFVACQVSEACLVRWGRECRRAQCGPCRSACTRLGSDLVLSLSPACYHRTAGRRGRWRRSGRVITPPPRPTAAPCVTPLNLVTATTAPPTDICSWPQAVPGAAAYVRGLCCALCFGQ